MFACLSSCEFIWMIGDIQSGSIAIGSRGRCRVQSLPGDSSSRRTTVPADHSIARLAQGSATGYWPAPLERKADPDAKEKEDHRRKHENRHARSSGGLNVGW